eukprot:gnl/MRDRNA2_/MRDRNA2_309694_c0_seq1.p1 gnl/MRDRNA2_/MRDRNA2_309694_c0~~gnl/MRDRNA2_/MRDRNA2_309694_c0_seq1.p1  ORF type:complete len:257 (-),score=26.69 gnl/MRDRNA2_/MRDRNA2_309694_c0_seq1:13-693(-)
MVGPYILEIAHGDVWLRRLLGAVLLTVFWWRVLMEHRYQRPPPGSYYKVCTWRHLPAATIMGLASAILGGLCACSGPPCMVFILIENVGKDEWRGSSALCSFISLPLRLLSIIIFDKSMLDFSRLWKESLVCFCFGLMGLPLGNAASKYISETNFRKLILLLLLYSGVVLVTAGTGIVTLLLLLVVSLMLVALLGWRICRQHQEIRAPEGQLTMVNSAGIEHNDES